MNASSSQSRLRERIRAANLSLSAEPALGYERVEPSFALSAMPVGLDGLLLQTDRDARKLE
jgi:hypothetical protein